MAGISRRDMLSGGIALSASSILARNAWARTAAALGQLDDPSAATPAIAPREKLLFDFDWKFTFGHGSDPAKDQGFGTGQGDFSKTGEFEFSRIKPDPTKWKFDESKWRTVNLPHDWAVELPFVRDNEQNSHGFKPLGRRYPETSIGWYRRLFDIPATDQGKRVVIEFDGAFRSVLVFVNGCFIGRNDNGYAPFRFDLTDFLHFGQKNVIVLRVDASFGDGWFYEGAGIYRHIWLTKTSSIHLSQWESYIRAEHKGATASLSLGTIVENQSKDSASARVTWKILDAKGTTVATAESPVQTIAADGSATYTATAKLANPALWSPDSPNLYSAVVTVEQSGKPIDAERIQFGVDRKSVV